MDTFGQNVTEFSAVTNRIMDTSVHDDKKQLIQKNPPIVIERYALGNFLWADPNMPILHFPK